MGLIFYVPHPTAEPYTRVHLAGGHALLDGRKSLLAPLAVGGEALLAVVVQAVRVGAVPVELARLLLDAALVTRLQDAHVFRAHGSCIGYKT